MPKNRPGNGFTLIELMIVVAIIGIIAAMALPDYMNFTARVKQSEAKANLAGIFTAEITYFAENSEFTGNFYYLGWSAQGKNIYAYKIGEGFNQICYPFSKANDCWTVATPIIVLPQNNDPPVVSPLSFTAIAYANLDSDQAVDTWQINDIKLLVNTKNDARDIQ